MFEIAIRLIAGVLLILANGFFVAIEFALTRVRQYPEEEFSKPGMRRAWEMTKDLEIYLTSCQVGITATSIALGIVAEPALSALFRPVLEDTFLASIGAGGILAFIIINLAHLTHGEQTPTYLGVERTKFVCRYGATPLYWFAYLLSPVIKFGDAVAKWTLGLFGVEMTGEWLETGIESINTRADLRHSLNEVMESGDMSGERRREVLGALDIDLIKVDEISVPIDEIVALSLDLDIKENLNRVRESHYTRYPLVSDDFSEFYGVVYAPSLLEAVEVSDLDLVEIASPPLIISRDTSVSEAIDIFQEEEQELALIVEPETNTEDNRADVPIYLGDGLVGLLTVTEALEEIVGEIRDPYD